MQNPPKLFKGALAFFVFIIFLIGISRFESSDFYDESSVLNQWVSDSTHQIVLFTGYPGCNTVCPRGLALFSAALRSPDFSEKTKSSTAFLFVNVLQGFPPDQLSAFVGAYHQEIIPIQPNVQSLNQLSSDLHFYQGKALLNPDEIDHSGFAFVLQKKDNRWILKRRIQAIPANLPLLLSSLDF